MDELKALTDDQAVDLLQALLTELAGRSYTVRHYTQDLIAEESKKFQQWCDRIREDAEKQVQNLRKHLREGSKKIAEQMIAQNINCLIGPKELEEIQKSATAEAEALAVIAKEMSAQKRGLDTFFANKEIPIEIRISGLFRSASPMTIDPSVDIDPIKRKTRRKIDIRGYVFLKAEGSPGFIHTAPSQSKIDDMPLAVFEELLNELFVQFENGSKRFSLKIPSWPDAEAQIQQDAAVYKAKYTQLLNLFQQCKRTVNLFSPDVSLLGATDQSIRIELSIPASVVRDLPHEIVYAITHF